MTMVNKKQSNVDESRTVDREELNQSKLSQREIVDMAFRYIAGTLDSSKLGHADMIRIKSVRTKILKGEEY